MAEVNRPEEAVALALFHSNLWQTWCGEELHIANEQGEDARHETARVGVEEIEDAGFTVARLRFKCRDCGAYFEGLDELQQLQPDGHYACSMCERDDRGLLIFVEVPEPCDFTHPHPAHPCGLNLGAVDG
jgi:hypothetical protein